MAQRRKIMPQYSRTLKLHSGGKSLFLGLPGHSSSQFVAVILFFLYRCNQVHPSVQLTRTTRNILSHISGGPKTNQVSIRQLRWICRDWNSVRCCHSRIRLWPTRTSLAEGLLNWRLEGATYSSDYRTSRWHNACSHRSRMWWGWYYRIPGFVSAGLRSACSVLR